VDLRIALALTALVALVATTACAPMVGTPSLTLLSQDDAVDKRFVAIGGRVKGSDCLHWAGVLFIWGVVQPSHEAVVQRMLEEHDADAILDAELTTSQYGLPYVYLQACANVEGTPARLVDRGGS
jgi:hypothetical protein